MKRQIIKSDVLSWNRLGAAPEAYKKAVSNLLRSTKQVCALCREVEFSPTNAPPAYLFLRTPKQRVIVHGICVDCCGRPDRDACLNVATDALVKQIWSDVKIKNPPHGAPKAVQ